MARSYEYAVLTAVPNPRRGERINIGIIVFRPEGFDVRFRHAEHKLRALTGDDWGDRIERAEARLKGLFEPTVDAPKLIEKIKRLDPLFQPSGLGYLNSQTEDEYNTLVESTLASLVVVNRKREKTAGKTRINTEIVDELKRVKLLAKNDESINDHKVVREFMIDPNEDLVADFALKNGKLMVAATLDLRKHSTGLRDAALKSITLDKAVKKYKDNVRTVGVYAVEQEMKENFISHISMLRDYSHELYEWSDLEGKRGFKKSIFNALRVEGEDLLS